ncbi:MAG: beta-lactamase family protein [Cytophagaceae bacterium]|nr:beta-lactamase family protein [Gemmatimonadaceae bacterium]
MNRRSAIQGMGASALLAHPALLPGAAAVQEDTGRLLRLASVPSYSLALVEGERITTEARGSKRAGDPEQVSADTVYAAASLTKAVFSYTFLGLVHEGLVSLDKPVSDYLPLPNPDDARSRTITARHLLSHSGGWRNWRNNASQALTADFDPGSRWSYSGEGFFFLQRVMENLTGKSFAQVARERVFTPLGMTRTSMAALAELEPHQASGHSGRGEPTQPFGRATQLELRRLMASRNAPLEHARVEDTELAIRTAEPTLPVLPNFLAPNAAASMLTTANDFARFLRHLVTARAAGGAPAAIVQLMMTPQVTCNEVVSWGLGVGLEQVGSTRLAWQWGDNPGFKNFFWADAVGGKAMAIFTNGDRGARVYERVIRARDGRDHPAFLFL